MPRRSGWRGRFDRVRAGRPTWLDGLSVGLVAAIFILPAAGWHEPPRFDGAGYVVLSEALATGAGYRAIDHPGRMAHANFPPGYPAILTLARSREGLWIPLAHGISALCGIVATVLSWKWFRGQVSRDSALLLGLAMAVNWIWTRTAGEILSEPFFVLLQVSCLLAVGRLVRARSSRGIVGAAGVGFLIGLAVLTRNVGLVLLPVVIAHLVFDGAWKRAGVVLSTSLSLMAPWVWWQAIHPSGTQVTYFVERGPLAVARENLVFYARRIPDLMSGPYVEVATIFSDRFSTLATVVASMASLVVVVGWILGFGERRRRLASMLGLGTLGLLLIWPFTEAGRFLIPILPCLLLAAHAGLGSLLSRFARGPRSWKAAACLLGLALPYSSYSLVSGRAAAQRARHAPFDIACGWIRQNSRPGELVVSDYPGEVYLQTNRQGLGLPPGIDLDGIDRLLDQNPGIEYLLLAPRRFANAPGQPLLEYVHGRMERVRRVHGDPKVVAVYRVVGHGRDEAD